MSLYFVAGVGASTDPREDVEHLPTSRPRRYPTDTSDIEWALVAGLIPAGGPVTGHGGRPVVYPRRDILDAIRYLIHNGCVWRALPVDYPPWRTVYHYFHAWTTGQILSRLHDTLREEIRLHEGRTAEPTAAIIDSQSVRAAETVAAARRGFDAAKKINGRKRHIAVDTTGLLLAVLVTAASVQDRDGATFLIAAIKACFRRITKIWADAGYRGRAVAYAAILGIDLEIVTKAPDQIGFAVQPRRWVVERTLAWISRCRRTVRDYERLPQHHAATVQWAMTIIMTRRLARYTT